MRSILTISIPDKERTKIAKRAKKAGKTMSAYFLWLAKIGEELIQEDELVAMTREAEKDYKAGETKELKSLKDLIES